MVNQVRPSARKAAALSALLSQVSKSPELTKILILLADIYGSVQLGGVMRDFGQVSIPICFSS